MFQIWKLVLLCGLLTGTSASLLADVGNDLRDVFNKELEGVDGAVKAVAENLRQGLESFQNSKIGRLSKQVLEKTEELLSDAVSEVLSQRKNILGLGIDNIHTKDIKTQLSPDGQGVDMNLPISGDVHLNLPLSGTTVDLKLSMDLLSSARIETQNGKSKVSVTQCAPNPASISLSLLDRRNKLANTLVDAATDILSQTLSTLVEKQVCPLMRYFVGSVSAEFLQNLINNLQPQSSV